MWDLIVSVPDHCLSFYFSVIGNGIPLITVFLLFAQARL